MGRFSNGRAKATRALARYWTDPIRKMLLGMLNGQAQIGEEDELLIWIPQPKPGGYGRLDHALAGFICVFSELGATDEELETLDQLRIWATKCDLVIDSELISKCLKTLKDLEVYVLRHTIDQLAEVNKRVKEKIRAEFGAESKSLDGEIAGENTAGA